MKKIFGYLKKSLLILWEAIRHPFCNSYITSKDLLNFKVTQDKLNSNCLHRKEVKLEED